MFAGFEGDFADDALGRDLAAALASVPSADRDALRLHVWADLTYA